MVAIDMYRIAHMYKWLKALNIHIFTPHMNELCAEIVEYSMSRNVTYLKFLKKIHQLLDPTKNLLLIDPSTKPKNIVNKVAYQISLS